MTDRISNINQFLKPEFGNNLKSSVNKSGSSEFDKILSKELSQGTGVENLNSDFPLPGVSPVMAVNFDQTSVDKVVSALSSVFSELDTLTSLLGNSDVATEDIAPLSDKLKSDMDDILKVSENSNIPESLKAIARESSALAYAASQKLDSFS